MKLNATIAKSMSAIALALTASASQAVGIFQEFTVSEGSVPGTPVNTTVIDKLNGGYSEVLTVNPDLTFQTSAYATFDSFYKNDGGTSVPAYIGSLGQYTMYATFTSEGALGSGNFNGLTGSFSLYIDPGQDTTLALGATGADAVIIGGVTSDDYLLGSSSVVTRAVGIPGTPGAFDFIFTDFALTTVDQDLVNPGNQSGAGYFTSPIPFYVRVNVNGDFDAFPTLPGPGTYGSNDDPITGDVSAVFPVPEPASLALLGIGLLGAGVVRRRKSVEK